MMALMMLTAFQYLNQEENMRINKWFMKLWENRS